jgi:hypothetical protein
MTSDEPKAEFGSVAKPEGYEDLLVWQKGMKLVKRVCLLNALRGKLGGVRVARSGENEAGAAA